MMAVTMAPAAMPISGFCPSRTKRLQKASFSFSGATAVDMVVIPTNSRPKPKMIFAISLVWNRLPIMVITVPTIMAMGASITGLRNFAHSVLDTSQPVMVVPILAPIITPMACSKFMMPALTKPTTMTVVADELWMTAVMPAPSRTPKNLFRVRISSSERIFPPAAFSRPWAMVCIP